VGETLRCVSLAVSGGNTEVVFVQQ